MIRYMQLLLSILLIGFAAIAQADWASVDSENSTVSFVSVKVKDIAEVHFFENVEGSISEDGAVNIQIDASSINTGIPIRDERMKEHLFVIADYPQISISAQIDIASLNGVESMQLPATFSLMGKDHPVILDILVSKSAGQLTVSSTKPVLVSAAQVGLTEGVAKLAELAGGISIGSTVPVSFVLNFNL